MWLVGLVGLFFFFFRKLRVETEIESKHKLPKISLDQLLRHLKKSVAKKN